MAQAEGDDTIHPKALMLPDSCSRNGKHFLAGNAKSMQVYRMAQEASRNEVRARPDWTSRGRDQALIVVRFVVIGVLTLFLGVFAIVGSLLFRRGNVFDRMARLWSRAVLKLCHVRTAVMHARGDAVCKPSVFIANHQSLFDVPALALAVPTRFRFVAKRELLRIPVFGWALWLAGFVFVDRRNRDQAIGSLRQAAARLHDGSSVIVFAEGTRTPDGSLQPFKKGGFMLALESGLPIVPVAIRGGREILPKGAFHVRPGTITICFGPCIDTGHYSYATRDELIAETRCRIEAGLQDVPCPTGTAFE